MPSNETLKEAERQLTVCNACRYCEGYCAVFPAMEARRTFATEDLVYMANLCFECRACYYACQFAPPHPFGINIPQALSALRVETYRDYATPSLLSKLFQRNKLAVSLSVAACVAVVFAAVLIAQGGDAVFSKNTREGAFFDVIPYLAMVIPALALSAYWLVVMAAGGARFWRGTGGSLRDLIDAGSFWRATKDAFGLHYLKGGEAGGCNYPGKAFSSLRRYAHHLVFYGVLFDLASTTVAAVYHNFLGRDAPYAYTSWPVVLGTIGGVMIVLGVAGMFRLKAESDRAPAHARMLELDVVFLALLALVSSTGLVLLVLRETAAMGSLLALHLALVFGLYLTLPYGKFAHVIYRYLALMKYRAEEKGPGA